MTSVHESGEDYFAHINHTLRGCHNYTRNFAVLVRLNYEKAVLLTPVLIYMVILIIAGSIGNALVIHVYAFRFKKTPSNRFILWLAILDITTCMVCMPFEIYDIVRPLRFNKPWACRFFRTLTSTTICTSSLVLIAVAFDRYFKAFKPFDRLKVRSANRFNCVSLMVGAAVSWPAMLIYGRKSICVRAEGLVILGSECSVDDSMRRTKYPFMYNSIMFLLFLTLLVCKSILYGRLGREVVRRKRNDSFRSSQKSKISEKDSSSCLPDKDVQVHPKRNRRTHRQQTMITNTSPDEPQAETGLVSQKPATNEHHSTLKKKSSMTRFTSKFRAGRTTLILFSVSLAFIVSFLPYLITKILQSVIKDFTDFSSDATEVLYNMCTRTAFINNAINPIIYGFLNPNFRDECRSVLKMLSCRWRDQMNVSGEPVRGRQRRESNSNSC